jgi:hypothetical protein
MPALGKTNLLDSHPDIMFCYIMLESFRPACVRPLTGVPVRNRAPRTSQNFHRPERLAPVAFAATNF